MTKIWEKKRFYIYVCRCPCCRRYPRSVQRKTAATAQRRLTTFRVPRTPTRTTAPRCFPGPTLTATLTTAQATVQCRSCLSSTPSTCMPYRLHRQRRGGPLTVQGPRRRLNFVVEQWTLALTTTDSSQSTYSHLNNKQRRLSAIEPLLRQVSHPLSFLFFLSLPSLFCLFPFPFLFRARV